MSPAAAPTAPGELGRSAQPQELMKYLEDLGNWVSTRRAELDDLDSIVQQAPEGQSLTADIRLGMSLWQAISVRYNLLLTTWDSGRVGPVELDKLSSQIWGRLDTGPAGTPTSDLQGMSLPEATKLSDALVAQLRTRLRIDPSGAEIVGRIRDLKAQVERLRAQVAIEPSTTAAFAQQKLAAIEKRLASIIEVSDRGGDIGGLLGPLESESAKFERDMIVNGVSRREQSLGPEQASLEYEALLGQARVVNELASAARAKVFPAPKYAVPDVAALGGVPTTTRALTDFTERLAQVKKALAMVEQANRAALTELADLTERRKRIGDQASPGVRELLAVADEMAAHEPVPTAALKALLDAAEDYRDYLLVHGDAR